LVWTVDSEKQHVQPYTIRIRKTTLLLKKSMTSDLVSLDQLLWLRNHPSDPNSQEVFKNHGVAINLKNCPNMVVIDFDNCSPADLEMPVTDESTVQHRFYQSLATVPSYREISVSGKGVHVIFAYRNFEKYTNNKFILKPIENVEIFVGGKVNKMLLLTGVSSFDYARIYPQAGQNKGVGKFWCK